MRGEIMGTLSNRSYIVLFLLFTFCIGTIKVTNPIKEESTVDYNQTVLPDEDVIVTRGQSHANQNPVKRALVVAIGEYPESGNWTNISSENDIPLVRQTLLNQGFAEENILVIKNEQATKEGIINAFNDHLVDKIKPGDIVYVHFSSHGQQMFDASGDEVDGYDEAIVPYNANLDYERGVYEGENHLNDDEVGEILTNIRKKLGPDGSLLNIIDACHSGTATRGLAKARGTKTRMEPYEYQPKTEFDVEEHSFIGNSDEDQNMLSPMVVISGASADELNYETQDENGNNVGSLTYAFTKVLSEIEGTVSYRELFDQIKIVMNRVAKNQTPQIEGDIDQQVFGGEIIKQEPYFIPQQWFENDTQFLISAGSLHGFTNGSLVHIYDFDVQDFENTPPLGTGKVVYSEVFEAGIQIDSIGTIQDKDKLKVVLESQSFEGLEVKVQLSVSLPDDQLQVFKDELENAQSIVLVEENADIVIEDNTEASRGSSFNIATAQDNIIYTGELSNSGEELAETVTQKVQAFSKANFLRKLNLQSPKYDVRMELVPFTYDIVFGRAQNIEYVDIRDYYNEANILELPEELGFKIKVSNRGTSRAYFTIANFTPDGKASLMIPHDGSSVNDFTIEPGVTKEIEWLYVVQKPYGNESIKLFATKEPLDLSTVLDPLESYRGTRSASSQSSNPFQMILENAASKTRSEPLAVPSAKANVNTISFKVVPADK